MFIFFVQTKKTNQKKIALLVKNNFINFVLKTKIHKLGFCPQTCEFLSFVHCINHKLFFNAGVFFSILSDNIQAQYIPRKQNINLLKL